MKTFLYGKYLRNFYLSTEKGFDNNRNSQNFVSVNSNGITPLPLYE